MKKLIILTLLTISLGIVSCGEDEDVQNKLLSGTIDGQDWTYQYAKVFYNEIDNMLDMELYGTNQTETDPCSIFISGEAHLSIQIPLTVGYYAIPGEVNVVFEQEGTGNESFNATSGYVEITEIQGRRIQAVMQASYDDQNVVEGNFLADRCN